MSSDSHIVLALGTLLWLPVLFTIPRVECDDQPSKDAAYKALFAFGDSILDTGNNNNLPTVSKCNFPPYGRDFPGGQPTGRFCDGKVPSDFIAQELGIKDLLPAYLDPFLRNEDLPTGVCFASGGSGFDPLTAEAQHVLSMTDQLNLFKEYTGKLKSFVGEEKAAAILNSSLYLVSAGNNDIALNYFLAHLRPIMPFPMYVDILLDAASTFFKDLYALGARHFAALGALPLGCLPAGRQSTGGLLCAVFANQAAQEFNTRFSSQLTSLAGELTGATFTYINVYDALLNLTMNPGESGFLVSDRGCFSPPLAPFPCLDPSTYVFWDAAHPTQKTYSLIVPEIVQTIPGIRL